jgi:hypothetical protein
MQSRCVYISSFDIFNTDVIRGRFVNVGQYIGKITSIWKEPKNSQTMVELQLYFRNYQIPKEHGAVGSAEILPSQIIIEIYANDISGIVSLHSNHKNK